MCEHSFKNICTYIHVRTYYIVFEPGARLHTYNVRMYGSVHVYIHVHVHVRMYIMNYGRFRDQLYVMGQKELIPVSNIYMYTYVAI